MNLIQILLPVYDNDGKPFARAFHRRVQKELTTQFGGLTAYSRAPADGLWRKGKTTKHDDIVVYEVMAEKRNAKWWQAYRVKLEKRFRQEEIIIRAQTISIL
jgi:hypothetical protein